MGVRGIRRQKIFQKYRRTDVRESRKKSFRLRHARSHCPAQGQLYAFLGFLLSGFRMTDDTSFMALFNCLLGPAVGHKHPRAVMSAKAQKSLLKAKGDEEAQVVGYFGLDA